MTTTIRVHPKLTHAEFLADARDRFGDNPADWAFKCPNCGDVATGRDFRKALSAHPRERKGQAVVASDVMGQECIGRTLGVDSERGCNWAAYGLLPGPCEVVMPDGQSSWTFELAPAPVSETASEAAPEDATEAAAPAGDTEAVSPCP
ncbi:hypothetical protein HY68_01310 [Streptomyces sp. AcH 505]|uniref:VVA0879 family protein n=1 Tax=Streptomyces sp. AcH 505 TaxID=352211 RepID=UPI000591C629|nr:hypothetical protein HY68_01310 [Streptomyces sp. AcH 505]